MTTDTVQLVRVLSMNFSMEGHDEIWFTAVADDDGTFKLVGAAKLVGAGLPMASIFQLFVDPEHRGQGIGTRLAEKAMETAWDSGCQEIRINVVTPDGPAEWWKSLGFAPLSPPYPTKNGNMLMSKRRPR